MKTVKLLHMISSLSIVAILCCCINSGLYSNETGIVIENQEFTETFVIDESNVIIRNCSFRNIEEHALIIRNAKNVSVENCTFNDIGRFGILLPNNSSTENVSISGCTFENIGVHGIHAAISAFNDHPRLVIENCTINNTGTAYEWIEHDHGIYVQSSNFIIRNNTISNSLSGHGISVRNYGKIDGNRVFNNYGACIDYYNDHNGSDGGQLIIENNICWDNDEIIDQASKNIIDIKYNSLHPFWVVDSVVIRFNTAVSFSNDVYPIAADSHYIDYYTIGDLLIYGNLVINTETESILQLEEQYLDNYSTTSLDHFADSVTQPYDFHLQETNPAREFYSGSLAYPEKDIDSEIRLEPIDAGADQY